MASPLKKKPMLFGVQRQEIISELVLASSKGKGDGADGGDGLRLPHGIFVGLAKKFNCNPCTVNRIWKRAIDNFEPDGSIHATPTKKGQCGRERIYDPVKMADAMEVLPSNNRKTLRQISVALGVSTTVMYRAVHGENSVIVPHTNSFKPFLSEENRYGRVCYAVDQIEMRTSYNEEQQ
jgi:hypothetical protein